jgi:hypothetical protein
MLSLASARQLTIVSMQRIAAGQRNGADVRDQLVGPPRTRLAAPATKPSASCAVE